MPLRASVNNQPLQDIVRPCDPCAAHTMRYTQKPTGSRDILQSQPCCVWHTFQGESLNIWDVS